MPINANSCRGVPDAVGDIGCGFPQVRPKGRSYPQVGLRWWRKRPEAARVEPHTGLRNGVTHVRAFDEVQARLDGANDLDSTMAVGWEAFELIYFVTHRFGGLRSNGFATWMWAMEPASDGGDALDTRPPRRKTGLSVGSADLAELSEDDAFRTLAALAVRLQDKLKDAALDPRPERAWDAQACARAAKAAAELYDLFVLDE